MRAVVYARVSSSAQREHDTIASQMRVLPDYVARQGWTLVKPASTYVDNGMSAKAGVLERRDGFAALMRDAAAKQFDVVVVVAIDRLTRSQDLTERGLILGAFQRAGVKIASVMTGQVLDFATELGDLVGMFEAFAAASDNRKRSERSRQGKLTAIARGRKPTGPTPYGLRYARADGSWSIDEAEARVVREVYERVAAGESCQVIARDFIARGERRKRGEWSRQRVWELASSSHTKGEWIANIERHLKLAVPAIVDGELWDRVQAELAKHQRRGLRRTKHVYLLEGLARCGACGDRINIRTGGPATRWRHVTHSQYLCRDRQTGTRGARCDAPWVRCDDVDARVWTALCERLDDPALVAEIAGVQAERSDRDAWEADIAGYKKHLARLERVEAAVLARFRRGTITEAGLDQELAELWRERDAVRKQLASAERASGAAMSVVERLRDAATLIERYRRSLRNAAPDERRKLLQLLVDPGGVVFRGDQVEIDLRFPVDSADSKVQHDCRSFVHENLWRFRLVA